MDYIAFLIKKTAKTDEIGQEKFTESKQKVFCTISSVSQNEFFKAGQNDIKAEIKIEVYNAEYNNEKEVEIDQKRYEIYRTYKRNDDKIELYLKESL